ncbi:MAG: DUF3842 family protein [Oscillospiraceae bacterium]
MKLVIIDGQGGGFGRALVEALRSKGYSDDIIAVGTNSAATSAMLRAGASAGATGENAVIVNAMRADIIAGPLGLVMANSMLGEMSPNMANAVAAASAKKVLIPATKCGVTIAGLEDKPLSAYINSAADCIISYTA